MRQHLADARPYAPSFGARLAGWLDIDRAIAAIDGCPWTATSGLARHRAAVRRANARHAAAVSRIRQARPLYTPDERRRRDESPWTLVQGVLAPVQFLVFVVSLALVLRTLATGEGHALATGSVVVKTLVLYAIMVTGSIWEKRVFGRYLFARPFFWEDMVSMLVLALHTAYLGAVAFGWLDATGQLLLALAAYAAYVVNAGQFVLKLRAARRQERDEAAAGLPASAEPAE
ncbi:2-vinyl bacteriochlorophyllide hydratase BchF [Caenispirillum salinarum AK4]|uniref:2-vinyl bacteriochlorophyllide hydratase BchF n=1 Tax=Caenispirillum salinarum AK4 TaxID=1238182 RepID=K9H713_9PROT|nr:2-vinyl bacteriochlorophyllide hydratase [Caenispirillum salinarum]EKV32864.1 2-vinyl bacteriochlorophyllide hydratase BchF [Caenispirillum salinarum AK4]